MGLKNIRLKLKAFKLRTFLKGIGKKQKDKQIEKRPSWMNPVSHGFHVVQEDSFRRSPEDFDSDSVKVQRQQIGDTELWFFGVFDHQVGNDVTKYLQSHLFDKHPDESLVLRKAKEVMRKAHLSVREKIKETLRGDGEWRVGSSCALVSNGCNLVMANMGGYRAIVCRNGEAHELESINDKQKRHWTRKLFKARFLSLKTLSPSPKSAELVVNTEAVDEHTELVILASTGVWQALSSQEAVDHIRRVANPQEAAQSLAMEAVRRGSRSSIACLIIHVGL